jgi:hypothetical protein
MLNNERYQPLIMSLCSTKHHAIKAHWGSGGIAPLIL